MASRENDLDRDTIDRVLDQFLSACNEPDEDSPGVEVAPGETQVRKVPEGVEVEHRSPVVAHIEQVAPEDHALHLAEGGESNFDKLRDKVEREGYSDDAATKIAAKVGDEKYGVEGMAHKAAEARKGYSEGGEVRDLSPADVEHHAHEQDIDDHEDSDVKVEAGDEDEPLDSILARLFDSQKEPIEAEDKDEQETDAANIGFAKGGEIKKPKVFGVMNRRKR